ncbi:MAG: lysine-2,3-aminomutase-like protein [Elstera sp.]|uniref:lysine-2,3-aminomutase-like protein n=1 Tax=Elstera sp. TaxID=1916664 RepID=UPI0037BEC84F
MTALLPRLAPTLRSLSDLTDHGLISAAEAEALAPVAERYAIALTPVIAEAIQRGAASGLSNQFLPDSRELITHPLERDDPIGDAPHSPVPGIVHRYADRALLKLVSVCAVYCRFCFRREMVGPGKEGLSPDELGAALAYIEAHPALWEIILTGGDPLVVAPRRLHDLKTRLDAIAHLGAVRIHTRVPVVAPERITAELVKALAGRLPVHILIHANHAEEFGPEARRAVARLVDAGIPLFGQSVLLRGVNDSLDALTDLFRTMVSLRIKPHYLHHGDLAPGTAHFRLPLAEGMALMRSLRGPLSGLALPTYMLDIPGGFGKVPVSADFFAPDGHGGWWITDPHGQRHAYRDIVETPY